MRQQMSAIMVVAGFLLAGCTQKNTPQIFVEPNPFGNLKQSAVCKVEPVKTGADGALSVGMEVRSDDGLCAVHVQRVVGSGKDSYASFGVVKAPEHGKTFIYNYNHETYVNYTPTTAYTGPDSFDVVLIPGNKEKRVNLHVQANVEAAGAPSKGVPNVTAPQAAPVTATKPAASATGSAHKKAASGAKKHVKHKAKATHAKRARKK